MYVGTPCQIAGLRLFLGKPYKNLYCVDLICHGVPSSEFFRKNIMYWENRYKSKVVKYHFRLKPSEHFKGYCFTLQNEKGMTIQKPYYYDAYYEAFYNFKSYNEMCYHCPYARPERTGDLTIGDYGWAIDHHPELKIKNNGKTSSISCLFVNSEQGEKLLEMVKDKVDLYETEFDWIAARNINLLRPTIRPKERDNIYKRIEKLGYSKWAKKYYRSEAFLKNIRGFSILFRIKRKILKKFRS